MKTNSTEITEVIHRYIRKLTIAELDSDEDALLLASVLKLDLIPLRKEAVTEMYDELNSCREIAHDVQDLTNITPQEASDNLLRISWLDEIMEALV